MTSCGRSSANERSRDAGRTGAVLAGLVEDLAAADQRAPVDRGL